MGFAAYEKVSIFGLVHFKSEFLSIANWPELSNLQIAGTFFQLSHDLQARLARTP